MCAYSDDLRVLSLDGEVQRRLKVDVLHVHVGVTLWRARIYMRIYGAYISIIINILAWLCGAHTPTYIRRIY